MTDLFSHTPDLSRVAKSARHIATALSGGPDSWALTLMVHNWCIQNNVRLTALTVDHRLRAESGAEAEAVARECARRGIAHHTLVWQHDGISSAVQQKARTARYAMLSDFCRANDATLLLTGHHADDQAETVLLRLAKASDVGGLGGLQPLTYMNGIALGRPLLGHTKQQLVDYASGHGVDFTEDQSNTNAAYARARLRHARSALEAEGLTTQNLVRLADKMRAADEALGFSAHQFITQHFQITPVGAVQAAQALFKAKPAALVQRALVELWRTVTGDTGYALGHDQLQSLTAFLRAENDDKITLGGMVVQKSRGQLTACRELAACTGEVTIRAQTQGWWDARFYVHNAGDKDICVHALGTMGRDRITALGPDYAWLQAALPDARATWPADVATGLPLLPAKNAETNTWAEFLAGKTVQRTLYSA